MDGCCLKCGCKGDISLMREYFFRSNLQTQVVERIVWISNWIHMSARERTFHLSSRCSWHISWAQTSLVGVGARCGYNQRPKSNLETNHWTEKKGKKLIIQTFITASRLEPSSASVGVMGTALDLMTCFGVRYLVVAHSINGNIRMLC